MNIVDYIIIALMAALFSTTYVNYQTASPISAIFLRWSRWLLIAFFSARLFDIFDWTTHPLFVLILIHFLFWFFLETLYNWIAISALSRSDVPLFPQFSENSGDEWPSQDRFIRLREWLRENRFEKVVALKADIMDGVRLRASIFQDPSKLIRLQVLFLPQRSGNISFCFIFSSQAQDGRRIVTDNFYIPYGGFYPEDWQIERLAWLRSPEKLLNRHMARMSTFGQEFVPWEVTPLIDLNQQQRTLERLNTELGFLVPTNLREEQGKLTWEGRYRVWMELWCLNYLGIARSY